jgi:hypothetical protein
LVHGPPTVKVLKLKSPKAWKVSGADVLHVSIADGFFEEAMFLTKFSFGHVLRSALTETEEAWAAEIRRTRHLGDFRKWKDHDEYQKAFGRLIRDLKAEAKMAR